MRGIIKIFKDRKFEDYKEVRPQRTISAYSSQLSHINPIEDPMSESETPENYS